MAEHATPATCGVDHVGLSVRDLESTRRFFCDCLRWRVVGARPEYPAAFVSDGRESWVTDLTIWLLLKFWQITHSRMCEFVRRKLELWKGHSAKVGYGIS